MILVQHKVVPQAENPVIAVKIFHPVAGYMPNVAEHQMSNDHADVDFRGKKGLCCALV